MLPRRLTGVFNLGRRLCSDASVPALDPQPEYNPGLASVPEWALAPLEDLHGRRHDYLRVSLTERCNLRCQYCMPPEGAPLSPRDKLLTLDELTRTVRVFAALGVRKLRLTGGEPTLRLDLPLIIEELNGIPGINSVSMTTNGLVLTRRLPAYARAGLSALNISLDSMKNDRYERMARRPGLSKVLAGIDLALQLGFPVKINVVLMKGFNDDEILDFVEYTKDRLVEVRFIEFMPFSGNSWDDSKLVPYRTALKSILERHPDLQGCTPRPNDTARVWQVPGYSGRVGFISSMTQHFCSTCNRLRITADGNLKVCLFGNAEVSLRDALRSGAEDADLATLIRAALRNKKPQHAALPATLPATASLPLHTDLLSGLTNLLATKQNSGLTDLLASKQNLGPTNLLASKQNSGLTNLLATQQNSGLTCILASNLLATKQNSGLTDLLASKQNLGPTNLLASKQNSGLTCILASNLLATKQNSGLTDLLASKQNLGPTNLLASKQNSCLPNLSSKQTGLTNLLASKQSLTNLLPSKQNSCLPNLSSKQTGLTNLLASKQSLTNLLAFKQSLTNLLASKQSLTNLLASKQSLTNLSSQKLNVRRYSTTPFSHLDSSGRARMVDVSAKRISVRTAAAECKLIVSEKLLKLLKDGALPKGDALGVARVAGVLAAKRTADLIPLCHQLPLDFVLITIDLPENDNNIRITCEVRVTARTGAEMEALTGCSGAALALYDMCKAVDKDMVISDLRVVRKSGGKSDYPPPPPPSSDVAKTPKPVDWPKETYAPINFAYL